MRYYWLSLLSGCLWAGVALFLAARDLGWLIIGGLIASPLIGLLIGFLYHPAYRLPKVAQVVASLLTLYLAVALFGLAVGTYDAVWRGVTDRIVSAVILQGAHATLIGVTPYVLLLWPLAYFNHRLLDGGGRAA